MIALAIPLLIVAGIVFLAMRTGPKATSPAAAVTPWLERWRSAGFVDEAQVDAILSYEIGQTPATSEHTSTAPVVAEALGYGGALLAAVGISVMIQRFDLTLQAGAIFAGCVAVFLLVASRFVDPDTGPAWWRLHQIVAFLGASALAFAVGLQAGGVAGQSEEATAFWVGAALTIVGWFLYLRRNLPVQQLGFFASCIILVTGASQLIDQRGQVAAGSFFLLGIIWLIFARRDALPPTTCALTIGAVLLIASPYPSSSEWPMFAFPVAAAIAALLVVIGGIDKRPPFVVVGLIALLYAVPAAIVMTSGSWVEGLVAFGFALFGTSLLLLGWSRNAVNRRVSQTTGSIMLALCGIALATTWRLSGLIIGVIIAIACITLGTIYRRSIVAGIGVLAFGIYAPWLIASEFGGAGVPIGLVVFGVGGIGVAARMLSNRAKELSKLPDASKS